MGLRIQRACRVLLRASTVGSDTQYYTQQLCGWVVLSHDSLNAMANFEALLKRKETYVRQKANTFGLHPTQSHIDYTCATFLEDMELVVSHKILFQIDR